MRNPASGAILCALTALALSGCLGDRLAGGTGVGNPTKGSVTVALIATDPAAAGGAPAKTAAGVRNPDGSYPIADAGGTVFTVRRSFANVGRIKIALPAGVDCSDADGTACEAGEVKLEGPFAADLLAGTWTPDPGALLIPVGSYRRMDVRLSAQGKIPAAGPDLSGHSLTLSGTFAYAGRSDRPFLIALDFDEDARFESDSGFILAEGSNRLSVVLDIGQWLSQADITACLDSGALPLDADGGISMTAGKDCGLGKTVKDAIKRSGKLRGERLEGR